MRSHFSIRETYYVDCKTKNIKLSIWYESESESGVRLFVTPRTLQSMEFSRPEYWSGQLFPFPGDLPNPRIEPRSPVFQADSLPAEPQGKTKSGQPIPSPGDLPNPGIEPGLLHCRQILYQLSY